VKKKSCLLSNYGPRVRPWIFVITMFRREPADDCGRTAPVSQQHSGGQPSSAVSHLFLLFDGAISSSMPVVTGKRWTDRLWCRAKRGARLGIITIVCTVLYAIPPTSILGAISIDRLYRRSDGIASADRQPAVQPHAVRVLSRADGMGRDSGWRDRSCGIDTPFAVECLADTSTGHDVIHKFGAFRRDYCHHRRGASSLCAIILIVAATKRDTSSVQRRHHGQGPRRKGFSVDQRPFASGAPGAVRNKDPGDEAQLQRTRQAAKGAVYCVGRATRMLAPAGGNPRQSAPSKIVIKIDFCTRSKSHNTRVHNAAAGDAPM